MKKEGNAGRKEKETRREKSQKAGEDEKRERKEERLIFYVCFSEIPEA